MSARTMTARTDSRPGRVWFVGAGPGSWDLLTIRAAACLQTADLVVHDALVPPWLRDAIAPTAELVPVERETADGDPGEATGRLLVRLAASGRTIVRLKGGDPAVFARLAEEIQPLRDAGIAYELVPGVTAALAAAAAAAAPLTSRATASSLTLVTGHEAGDKPNAVDFRTIASLPGTLAIYMGIEQMDRWSTALLEAGKPAETPVTIVSRCSWPDQRIITSTLARCAVDAAAAGLRPPAIAIVGAAAGSMQRTGPLAGRRVLVTRPAGQGEDLATAIRGSGGEAICVPVVRLDAPDSWQPLDDAIGAAGAYDWIVFSSVNGVRGFVARLRAAGRDARWLGTARIAAIGSATRRELDAVGLACDLVPDEFRSEGLAAAFADLPAGGRFLLVRADRGRDVLPTRLAAAGHHVVDVAAYTNRPLDELDAATLEAVDAAGIDWVTVTSPSIAAAAARLFGDRMRRWRIASISPVTTAALTSFGLQPAAEAQVATVSGLVAAMATVDGPR
jgi:uroporphyrinogen III methyltransferase / synthase